MLKRIFVYAMAFMLAAGSALADSNGSATGGTAGTQSTGAGCINQSPTLSTGQQATLVCDSSGNLKVSISGGSGGTVTANQGTPNAGGANAWPVAPNPSSASTSGVAPVQSASVETGHVIKASPGNLYDFNVSADATLAAAQWEVLVFNSTTVPASGAVTPVKCYIVPAGTTSVSGAFPTPLYLGTGISMAVSTAATCFTKTDSAHGFISADAQ